MNYLSIYIFCKLSEKSIGNDNNLDETIDRFFDITIYTMHYDFQVKHVEMKTSVSSFEAA